MEDLAIILRGMQFYAHQAHNLISGDEFFQDHAFLGDLYPKYESDYDDVIERMIGLGQSIDIAKVTKEAASILDSEESMQSNDCIEMLLVYEKSLCETVGSLMSGVSHGTQQLIGEMANQSEIRQYKMKQRLAKGGQDD